MQKAKTSNKYKIINVSSSSNAETSLVYLAL